MRHSINEPTDNNSPDLDWTVALAGGEGVRLADYVTQRFGERIPKQYCRVIDDRSMLEHTLDRMNQLTPAARTLTVIGTDHNVWAQSQLIGRSDHVFCQPMSRDTGVALYVALAMVKRWHPNAVVTVVPTDHYVAPPDRYLECVTAARSVAANYRDMVVLLGIEPTEPDPELGYIVLGAPLTEVPDVRIVESFVEKPSVASAMELSRSGALWSTMVVSGSVSALWELGRTAKSQLFDDLDSLVDIIGTEDEDDAIDYIYRSCPSISFSRDICQRAPQRIAAMSIGNIEWSDFGKPERIEKVIARRKATSRVPLPRDKSGGVVLELRSDEC